LKLEAETVYEILYTNGPMPEKTPLPVNPFFVSRDLASNQIDSLEGNLFKGLSLLHDLLLCNNAIQTVPEDAFHGLPALQLL
jgi:hypothetical protein